VKIDLMYVLDPSFGPSTHEDEGIGGSENFATYSAEYLALAGHQVRMYNKIPVATTVRDRKTGITWEWLPLEAFSRTEARDVLMTFRSWEGLKEALPHTRLKVIALADTESYSLGDAVREGLVDKVMFVSQWQAEKICAEEGLDLTEHIITSNGVSMKRFDKDREHIERLHNKCIHLSTPERGLEPLLRIWPMIQQQAPDAELHLFSSFFGWRVSNRDNASMCSGPYQMIEDARAEGMKIFNHQHCSAKEMRVHLLSSRLLLYPTDYFDESCCISAIEASAAGVPIVCTDRAALKERVRHGQTGYLIAEREDKAFADHAVDLLTYPAWHSMSGQSILFARRFDYDRLVRTWARKWEDAIAVRR